MARLEEEEREKQRIIGERVAQAREAKRLTQPIVADRVNVTLRAYQNWEAGSTRIAWPNLERLADVLDVSADWILTGIDEPAEVAELPTGLQSELAAINRKLDRILKALDAPRKIPELSDESVTRLAKAVADRARRAPAKH